MLGESSEGAGQMVVVVVRQVEGSSYQHREPRGSRGGRPSPGHGQMCKRATGWQIETVGFEQAAMVTLLL